LTRSSSSSFSTVWPAPGPCRRDLRSRSPVLAAAGERGTAPAHGVEAVFGRRCPNDRAQVRAKTGSRADSKSVERRRRAFRGGRRLRPRPVRALARIVRS
jgi:hypothetical protein